MRIKAILPYSNGSIEGAVDWKRDEVRDLPANVYERLVADQPRNFVLLPPEVQDAPEERNEQASDQPEHSDGEEARQAPKASRSNRAK